MPDDFAPTVAERYSVAINSSRLELKAHKRGDVDLLIAAGVFSDTLGSALLRLRTEFDTAKASAMREAGNSETGRLLAFMSLRTLPEVKQRFGAWTLRRSAFFGYRLESKDALAIAGRVLNLWLDPTCPLCSGRGFNGGYDGPQVLCNARKGCKGSGKRRDNIGRTPEERELGADLLSQMDWMAQEAASAIGRAMRGD